jgi:hypothetical protein
MNYLLTKNKLDDFQIHRNPLEPFSFPTSLAMSIIGEYYDEVSSVVPGHTDLTAAEELCFKMMGFFGQERERMDAATYILQGYFGRELLQRHFSSATDTRFTTDGTISILLPSLKETVMIFNREDKNEMGTTDASAVEECLWYHFRSLCRLRDKKLLDRCCCPAILASLVGPYLSFSVGIQCGGRYVTDPVTPFLHLMVLPYQQDTMIKVAQALRATKNAIEKIIMQYQNWDNMSDVEASNVQLKYPYRRSFNVLGDEFEFKYLHSIPQQDNNYHHLVYLVEITKSSNPNLFNIQRQLVVKFTKNYGCEVHAGLADLEMAPALYTVVELPGGWKMVVMEYVSWPSLFDSSFNDEVNGRILVNVKRALDYLSSNSFVHGDLRANNILVNPDGQIRIVDFDYSGSTTGPFSAHYPPFLNVATITWPPGVTRGGLMNVSHDNYFYQQMFPHLGHS